MRIATLLRLPVAGALAVAAASWTSVDAASPYPNGFPADSSFFPIGVWLQSPHNAREFRAIGINTLVGLWQGPTEQQLAELVGEDMFVIAGQNEIGLASPQRQLIKAWLQPDEPDNAQRATLGRFNPCTPADEVARRSRDMKVRDPTRPVMINFGRGVADTNWHGRGTCTGDQGYYDVAIDGADILSFDIYPVGSDTPSVKGHLEYVARGVSNLTSRSHPGQVVWAFIETTALDPARPIRPAELRAEAWMAIIHGARGLVYFVHEWTNGFREDGIFRHPEIVAAVGRLNETIRSLAEVLNDGTAARDVVVSTSGPLATMMRLHKGSLYIMAVAMSDRAVTARFTIADGGTSSATVLDEDRSIGIAQGAFKDEFTGYAAHLYRVPIVSSTNSSDTGQ
jgi:hypothetical protein